MKAEINMEFLNKEHKENRNYKQEVEDFFRSKCEQYDRKNNEFESKILIFDDYRSKADTKLSSTEQSLVSNIETSVKVIN
jgi:hypothetical protein